MANELACLNCGKGFTPTCHITRQKFCSSECRVRYNNAKRYCTDTPVNEYPEYGTPIQQSGEAGRWRRFCGKRCRQLYHYKKWLEKRQANYQPPVQICPNCGKDFQPEWGPGTQHRSASTSAGQQDRIGQSAGADHEQQICACAAALQTGAGAAQARSARFPADHVQLGSYCRRTLAPAGISRTAQRASCK